MHLKAASRVTGPQIKFDLMKKWIYENKALVTAAELDGNFIGFGHFNLDKGSTYYSSAANDPERDNLPISHLILWDTLCWLKEHNFNHFEIGPFSYPSILFYPSEKEEAIARFKRGFGG